MDERATQTDDELSTETLRLASTRTCLDCHVSIGAHPHARYCAVHRAQRRGHRAKLRPSKRARPAVESLALFETGGRA